MPKPPHTHPDNFALAVAHLRQITASAEDDVFNGVTYWTDDQLIEILERHESHLFQLPLKLAGETYDGLYVYKLASQSRNFWCTQDAAVNDSGTDVTDAVTIDYKHNLTVTSATELVDPAFTELNEIDMNGAAAEVWRTKAQQRSHYADWRAGSHSVKSSQEYEHCLSMAKLYESKRVKSFNWKGRR